MKTLYLALLAFVPLAVAKSLADRIAHNDPAQHRRLQSVHGGAVPWPLWGLLDARSLETNLYFLHRGVIEPGGGIGHHFHNNCEEMFVILNGEAEFTINGRTSRIKEPAGVPNVMGDSHAIYNPTDQPLQWMNINVTAIKGEYWAHTKARSAANTWTTISMSSSSVSTGAAHAALANSSTGSCSRQSRLSRLGTAPSWPDWETEEP